MPTARQCPKTLKKQAPRQGTRPSSSTLATILLSILVPVSQPHPDYRVFTTSSIFRMLRTVSVARVNALTDTNRGWTTISSRMLEIPPFRTLMPVVFSPWAWRFLSSVTVEMGFRPAFSASVDGMTSMASAKARTQ